MTISDGLAFWHDNLGRFLSDAEPEKSAKAAVPTWLGKDDPEAIAKGKGLRVAPWPLGAKIPLFYIVTRGHAWVFGKIALENSERLTVITSTAETRIDGRREIARWLSSGPQGPFMVGVITEANPNSSFRITHHARMGYFCEAGGGYPFDLEAVCADVTLLTGMPWKEVATSIYRFDDYRNAEAGSSGAENARNQLGKLFRKMPALQGILPKLQVRPGSGEMELLRLLLT